MDPDLRIESNPQQIISRIVQASGSHGSISEKLADIVYPQIIRSFATLVRGENAEMRLQLQPGDLGEIELRVRTTEAIVRGEMMVQNPEVKALLEKHMERLRVALAEEAKREVVTPTNPFLLKSSRLPLSNLSFVLPENKALVLVDKFII